jgi:microcystin degradation protein MlrC
MRVGIIGLQHESNSFMPNPTTLADFQRDILVTGDAVRTRMGKAFHEVGGFFEALDNAGVTAVPILMARAVPSGVIEDAALDHCLDLIKKGLEAAGPLDGLLVAPHGAAIGQSHPDMDGYWVSKVREWFGKDKPIVMTLDLHTNLSAQMVAAADATVLYGCNPHLDQRERGIEAANLMIRTLKKEIKPVQAAAFPAIAINIERQHTFEEPCVGLYQFAQSLRSRPGVLYTGIALGFAYSDVQEMGSAFIAVTDNEPVLAQKIANELAQYVIDRKQDFVAVLTSPEDAVTEAARRPGPICMLDMGDNVGGGAPGDGVLIAHVVHKRCGPKTFTALWDPEAQAKARAAGVGAKLKLAMGGKSDKAYGPPLVAEVMVIRLHDGKFTEPTVTHWGMTDFDMGPTAVVETETGLTIQLTTNRTYPTSLVQITTCGLDPVNFHILIAKGVHAPIGAYKRVCKSAIRVNTPGHTTADLSLLTFHHRRKPLFPFER